MVRLLLVDDTPKQMDLLREAAIDAGFEAAAILEAVAVKEAYEVIDNTSIDLAVVDIMLSEPPGAKEGLAVIERLLEKHERCRVIALTKDKGEDNGVEALEAGAHDFIGIRWQMINWVALLVERLKLWKRVLERQRPRQPV